MRKMSRRENRVAKAWMAFYKAIVEKCRPSTNGDGTVKSRKRVERDIS